MNHMSEGHHIVVIGGSAGSGQAFKELVGYLDKDLPASIFVVLHTHERAPRVSDRWYSKVGTLPVSYPAHQEFIEPGKIYLAPPNQHLLVTPEQILLSAGPQENRSRPAIDPLFRSAAVSHGANVIGIILTGLLDDGTMGLSAIQQCGGYTMVQDPKTALYPDMPLSAMGKTNVDFIGSVQELAEQINAMTHKTVIDQPSIPLNLQIEAKMTERLMSNVDQMSEFGSQVSLSCPSCAGPLWKCHNNGEDRYRCHMGHAFSSRTLLLEQDEAVERALWLAVRTLEERGRMLQNMADKAIAAQRHHSAMAITERAREAIKEAQTIHAVIRDLIHPESSDVGVA